MNILLLFFLFSAWSNEVCISSVKKSFLPVNSCNPISVDNEGGVFIVWEFSREYNYHDYVITGAHINKYNIREGFLSVSRSGRRQSIHGAGDANCFYKDSTVYFIWDDRMIPINENEVDYENEVFYRVFYWNINNGTFGHISELTSNDLKYSYSPSATMDEYGNIYVAWEDLRTGIPQIFYKEYRNGIWSEAKQISQSPYFAVYPSVTVSNGRVYIFWEDGRDKAVEIYMREITGDSISPEQRITDNDGYFSYGVHSTSSNDGSIHIVWVDEKGGYPQVYYKKYSNNVWSSDTNVSNSASEAVSPSIVVDIQGKPHIIWIDKGENEGDVYYTVLGDTAFVPPVKVNKTTIKCENPFVAVDTMGIVYTIWSGIYEGQYYNQRQIIFRRYTPDKNTKSTRSISKIVSRGPLILSKNNDVYNKAVVYDIMGRRIKTVLPDGGRLKWQMDDKNGERVKNGIYFIHIEGKNAKIYEKVVYIGGRN